MKLTMVRLGLQGCKFTDFVYIKPCEDGKIRLSPSMMDSLFIKHFGRTPFSGETINIG